MARLFRACVLLSIGVMASCDDKLILPNAATPTATPRVTSVIITPGSKEIEVGQQLHFVAAVLADGPINNFNVTWSSSNNAVATIDGNGVLTAVGAGTAIVQATSVVDQNGRGVATVVVRGTPSPVPPPAASTTYNVVLSVTADASAHEQLTRYTTVRQIVCSLNGSTLTITGAAPWVTVTGNLNANGTFTATGQGTVAGRANVTVTVTGTAAGNSISGTIVLGPGLPDNNESLSFTGSRQ